MRTLLIGAALGALLALPATAQRQGRHRAAGTAVVGKKAPDFTATLIKDSKTKVTLSKLAAEKPVLLIFGSYT